MAPRTAKAKKSADIKMAESEAPKKGKSKSKNYEANEQEVLDIDIADKAAPMIKAKRGKKAQETNGEAHINGVTDNAPPPAKKGKKKNELVTDEKTSNGDNSTDEETTHVEQNNDQVESNGTAEDTQPASTGRGRKKQIKDEKPKETASKGRKAKPASEETDEKELNEEKSKGKGRGRKVQAKAEVEEDKTDNVEEEEKSESAKGKKRGQGKKEKTPESEKELSDGEDKIEEPKKKGAKGRKGKKAQAKEEVEDKKENVEEEDVKESASKKRKVTKKDDKRKGDAKEEEANEEIPEVKSTKGKRSQKKAIETPAEVEDEPQDTGEPTNKRRRKPAEDKAAADTKTKAPPKNKATTNYEELDFSNPSKSLQGKEWNFKIASWNVDGVRAWMGKGGLDYIKYEKPDILCLQELKCGQEKLPDEIANLPGYHAYWLASDKDGYAGVGIYTSQLAINVQYGLQNEELDTEGRIITAEYEQFYLICTYVPNAGRKLITLPKRLQWNQEFRKHVQQLDKKKPVIICGDMNVAHNEIDLANPKTNKKNAGFTEEERAGMTELLGDGFVDTYRHLYPDKTGAYTFWTYMMNARSKNVGWRLDYFIVSERLLPSVCDNVIRDQVYGSDHCPISLFLHLTSADKPKE